MPASIKIELNKFLHRKNIELIHFLRNRPDSFYLNYLERFRPVRFDKGDLIFEADKKPREIYLSFKGKIINVNTNRIFPEGSMIGQDDILYNRDRTHTYKAYTEVFTLKLEREIFEKMLKEFSEIREELLSEANERK